MTAALASPSRWTWPPLLRASVVLHGVLLVLVMVRPSTWPWLLAALVLNHAVITLAGLWPRADWLGPNLTRLPAAAIARRELALTIDDGPDPDLTPAVLDLLDAAGARATFFCIAERAERHPALVAEIVRRGHSVQNHSLRHRHTFSLLGLAGYRRELAAAQAVLGRLAGRTPEFFRAPAGLRNPFLDPVLHALGLTLASWTRRGYDTRERDPQRVLDRLLRDLAPGDILLLHDGHAARTSEGTPVVLAVLPTLLARLQAAGLRAVTLPEACRDLPMRRPAQPVPPGPTR